MAVSVVSFSFSRAAQPEPWSPLFWVLAFLTTSRPTPSPTLLNCPPSVQFVGLISPSNSHAVIWTRLHAFTAPQFLPISGDRDVSLLLSLERPAWLSSSGNNCHAVQRSLSYGASVYESIMGFFFTSSHFISQFPPTWFPLITAIRMCHFLPVHGLAFSVGSKGQNITPRLSIPLKKVQLFTVFLILNARVNHLNLKLLFNFSWLFGWLVGWLVGWQFFCAISILVLFTAKVSFFS